MTGLEIAAIAAVAGTAAGAVGGLQQASAIRSAGKAQRQQYEYQAKQGEIAAGQKLASSQRRMREEDRRRRIIMSKAQNVAAGQGGTLDSSFVNIMGALDTEGRFRSDVAEFEGKSSANKLLQQSDLLRYQGDNAVMAANAKAKAKNMSTIGNTLTSLGSIGAGFGGSPEDMSVGYSPSVNIADGVPIPNRKPNRGFY